MLLELRSLNNFRILARELHFGNAARIAGISQSSLSEQIKRMEDVIGVPLFTRDRHSVALTAPGLVLMRSATELLLHHEKVLEATRRAGGISQSRLVIGYSSMAMNTPMPAILHAFQINMRDTKLTVQQQSSAGSERLLMDREFDCLFVPAPEDHPEIETLTILNEPIHACLPAWQVDRLHGPVEAGDFAGQDVIFPELGSRFGSFVEARIAESGAEVRVTGRVSRPSVMLTQVATGAGIGFLPNSMRNMAPEGVVTIPLPQPAFRIPFCLVWRRGEDASPLKELISLARQTAGLGDLA